MLLCESCERTQWRECCSINCRGNAVVWEQQNRCGSVQAAAWMQRQKCCCSLIINLLLAVFYLQSLPWEGLNKPQGDPDSSSSCHFSLCPPQQVSSAWFFCEASSSIFSVLLLPRQSLRTICFWIFVLEFCSWLKNSFSNEEVEMFRVLRVVSTATEQALLSTYGWAPRKMHSMLYLPVHCGDASVLHHLVSWMLPHQGMHSQTPSRNSSSWLLRSYPLGLQLLPDLFTIFWRCLNLCGRRLQTRLRIGHLNSVPCLTNCNRMAFAHWSPARQFCSINKNSCGILIKTPQLKIGWVALSAMLWNIHKSLAALGKRPASALSRFDAPRCVDFRVISKETLVTLCPTSGRRRLRGWNPAPVSWATSPTVKSRATSPTEKSRASEQPAPRWLQIAPCRVWVVLLRAGWCEQSERRCPCLHRRIRGESSWCSEAQSRERLFTPWYLIWIYCCGVETIKTFLCNESTCSWYTRSWNSTWTNILKHIHFSLLQSHLQWWKRLIQAPTPLEVQSISALFEMDY